jgi:hypothetical protein
MNNNKFNKLIELAYTGGHLFRPINQNAFDICNDLGIGEIITVENKTSRDLKFHQCYFVLIHFIYDYLPDNFHEKVPKKHFYKWLQTLKGDYDVVFTFSDGKQLIEYESLAFGRMSQNSFENYIREQLPWIYENVIGAFYSDDKYDGIIQTIEDEFKKFLSKL